jgi:hypothetical protein
MNDIADTSVRIQTSAEDRLFEKRARSEKFFSCPHAMLAFASTVRHVEPSREETRRALSRTQEHEIQRRDLAASPFSHHPTIEKECFS